MQMSDLQIRQLAWAAAQDIKSLTSCDDDSIKAIYQRFRSQVKAIQAEASAKSLSRSGAGLLSQTANDDKGLIAIMTKPLGYYASALPGTQDAEIFETIETRYGSQLQALTNDDRAACLIMLIEAATVTPQAIVQDSFDEEGHGWGLWQLTQHLTPGSKLNLCVALINQLVYGGH
jgi:hypothetical protein